MKLAEARKWIQLCLIEADAAYGDTVFDEWMIVQVAGLSRDIVYYSGPRYDKTANFQEDLVSLKRRMQAQYHVGDLEFAHDGEGPAFDMVVIAGKELFVVLNNTSKSLKGLALCSTWANAQLPLVKMAEHFHSDPLQLR